MDKLGGSGCTLLTATARFERAHVVYAALFPLVVTVIVDAEDAPVAAALALLPTLVAALEPVRAAADAFMSQPGS